jgi:hypothetical protein
MSMVNDKGEVTLRSKFWNVNAGQLLTAAIFVAGLVYAAGAFASKSNTDTDNDRQIAAALARRIELVDAKTSGLEGRIGIVDGRMISVETSVVYIRESLARIERAVTPQK